MGDKECYICSGLEADAAIIAAAKVKYDNIIELTGTVDNVNIMSGFTTMTEGFNVNNFWGNWNNFFNRGNDLNEVKETVKKVNDKSSFTTMTEGFTTVKDTIKELNNWTKYASETKTKFDSVAYTAMISNIKNNDRSGEEGSVRKELKNQEEIFNKNYILFQKQTIDDLINQINSYKNQANDALSDAKRNYGNINNDKNIAKNDLNSITDLLNKASDRISLARKAYNNMSSAVDAIELIIDTPCTYNDTATWSDCKSDKCRPGDATVTSNITRKKYITNWKCNSNNIVVKGNDSSGRYIGEEKSCNFACPCVYSEKETPINGNSCSRTCSSSSSQEDVNNYNSEALWNVYHNLENGPGSCPLHCDKSGMQTTCKPSTVGSCAIYPAPICQPTGFNAPTFKSGFTTMNEGFSALTNRPLEGIKHECPCKMNSRNDLSSVKPYYNDGEYSSSVSTDRTKEIPIILQKNRNQYFALQDTLNTKGDNNVYSDSWADIPTEKEMKKTKKMDVITQFYFGSLSIVALFIVFRMIQKTK